MEYSAAACAPYCDAALAMACGSCWERGSLRPGPDFFASDRLREYLDGEATQYALKHLTKKRVGVDWVDKDEGEKAREGHAKPPRCCIFGTHGPQPEHGPAGAGVGDGDSTHMTRSATNPVFNHHSTMRLHQTQVDAASTNTEHV